MVVGSRPHYFFSGHVHDRVMHEYGVEDAAQPHRAHVASQMLTLRIDRSAHLQHLRRQVDQRHLEVGPEMRCVVPAPGAQLEQRARRRRGGRQQVLAVDSGFLGVLARRGEQVEPGSELAVQPHPRTSGLASGLPGPKCLSITRLTMFTMSGDSTNSGQGSRNLPIRRGKAVNRVRPIFQLQTWPTAAQPEQSAERESSRPVPNHSIAQKPPERSSPDPVAPPRREAP